MQKLEKIRPSRSSLDTSPVISPSAWCASRSSCATSSPACRVVSNSCRRLDMLPCPSQRIDVPRACGERAFRRGMKADAVLEVLAQAIKARARPRAQVDTRRAALPRLNLHRIATAIDLVEHERERNLGRHMLQVVLDGSHRLRIGRIDDEQHAVRARDFVTGTPDAFGFHLVRRFAQACGVQDVQRQAVDRDAFTQHVTRRAGRRGDDRGIVTGQSIQQARLAGIRSARNDDRQAVTQQCALAGGFRKLGESLPHVLHALTERTVRQEVDFFLGKIDGRLDPEPQQQHGLGEFVHARGELALQRAQRRARCLRGSAVDQVGNRFGLREVELVVEVGALRELACRRRARAERQHPLLQQLHHHGPAVPLQLEHVFAGERMRARKEQRQTGVDGCAVGVEKLAQLGTAWFRHGPEQGRAIACVCGPDTRTMPMPPRPGAVAIAAIVSVAGRFMPRSSGGRQRQLAVHQERLQREVAHAAAVTAVVGHVIGAGLAQPFIENIGPG